MNFPHQRCPFSGQHPVLFSGCGKPSEGMIDRTVRTKLDYKNRISNTSNKEKLINERDRQYKEKVKQNAENRKYKRTHI